MGLSARNCLRVNAAYLKAACDDEYPAPRGVAQQHALLVRGALQLRHERARKAQAAKLGSHGEGGHVAVPLATGTLSLANHCVGGARKLQLLKRGRGAARRSGVAKQTTHAL
jgi:hypothetical protein